LKSGIKYPRIFFIACIGGFVTVFGFGVAQPFLPLYAMSLGASETIVGWVVSFYFASRLFIELPSGVISDRIGRRGPLLAGMFLSFLGALLCSLASEPVSLILGRGVWGAGTALFFSSSTAFVFDLFEAKVRSQAMGMFQSIEFIGSFIGAPLGGAIASYVGMRTPFMMVAILAIVGFILLVLSREFREKTSNSREKAAPGGELSLRNILDLFKIWGLGVVNLGSFGRNFVMQGVVSTVFPLYVKNLGMDVSLTGIIMGIRSAGMITGTYVTSKLIKGLGVPKTLFASFCLEALTTLLYAVGGSFEWFLLVGYWHGFASGVELNSMMTSISIVVPTSLRGTGVGIYRTFMDLGSIIGPIGLTALLAAVGYPNIKICFYVSAIMATAVAITMLTLHGVEMEENSEHKR